MQAIHGEAKIKASNTGRLSTTLLQKHYKRQLAR